MNEMVFACPDIITNTKVEAIFLWYYCKLILFNKYDKNIMKF